VKQSCIADSTTETVYVAACEVGKEIYLAYKILDEWCDEDGTVSYCVVL
jgi:hypothetical protein